MRPLYRFLATKVQARLNCKAKPDQYGHWLQRHEDDIVEAVKRYLPSGSGFDSGTQIDLDRSTGEKLVFTTSFHHMHESGMYDGWTEHTITVKPSLMYGFSFTVSGRDRNYIKDLIGQTFDHALRVDTDKE